MITYENAILELNYPGTIGNQKKRRILELLRDMQSKLTASQQRERAAVEDITSLLRGCTCEHRHEYCDGFGSDDCTGHYPGDCSGAKWRGPQEAGEGGQDA